MPETATPENHLAAGGAPRSVQAGDLPERLRARYYVETHGREQRVFADARVPIPLFRDRGRELSTRRADPNVVRELTAIAAHRGWRIVDARGALDFRREAWLAGRAAGLEVRGYRPTERDLQALDKLTRAAERQRAGAAAREARTAPDRDPLAVIGTVVRARVADPEQQARLMASARARIAHWLERGARFESPLTPDRGPSQPPKERRRAR